MNIKGIVLFGFGLLGEIIAEVFNVGIFNISNLSGSQFAIPITIIIFLILGIILVFK